MKHVSQVGFKTALKSDNTCERTLYLTGVSYQKLFNDNQLLTICKCIFIYFFLRCTRATSLETFKGELHGLGVPPCD